MLSLRDVVHHNSRSSCWVVVSGQAYDVTDFLDSHPGGPNIILRYAGKDATKEYEPVHPPGTIEKTLSADKHMGQVDPSELAQNEDPVDKSPQISPDDLMPLEVCQNLDDIEEVARRKASRKAWVYFSSAADSLQSLQTNRQDWSKVTFRPRVLRNVERVNMQRTVMGHKAQLPFFVSPAAMARLGHPDGELCLSRAAADWGIVHCVSTYSSVAHDDLAAALHENGSRGALAFQLYVPKVVPDAKNLIAKARELRCTALVVTVDTPVVGKREEDERYKAQLEDMEGHPIPRLPDAAPGSPKPVLRGHHAYTLDWDDLHWMRREWGRDSGPFILKGIQTAEDALKAAEIGVDAIWLSNHGGRQLDFAPSSIRTLLEIRKFYPQVLRQVQIYMDGGVRRGTDIVKALCLGATACGLGRPFMYGLTAGGTDGVARAIQLLSEEIETTMRLLGVNSLDQLDERYVNCKILENELPDALVNERAKL